MRTIEENKTHWATFNRFEFEIPAEAVRDCSHQGACDQDVDYWHSKISLSHISDAELAEELREYGAWDAVELADREANEKRIIWIAAGDIQESEEWDNVWEA
jgi:hypothetical protein